MIAALMIDVMIVSKTVSRDYKFMEKALSFFVLVLAVSMLLFSTAVMAGGGTWKMGPFGPYWDDNSWPEFTPMYWMEEFLNRIDDDDSEIQQWMMRNQYSGGYPGQYPVPPSSGHTSPLTQNYFGWPPVQGGVPVSPRLENVPSAGTRNEQAERSVQPVPIPQTPVPEAFDSRSTIPGERPSRASPPGGRQRSPPWYPSASNPASPYPEFAHLPNLTPQEFSRMPPQLQQQYERAFDQAFMRYQKRREIERVLKQRPPIYNSSQRGYLPRSFPQR